MRPEFRREPKPAAQPEPARPPRAGGHEDRPRPPADVVAGVGFAERLVRLESGDGRNRRWVEPAALERLLADGWKRTGKQSRA